MIGMPYQTGYVIGMTKEDILLVQPYLKYSGYLFDKLCRVSLPTDSHYLFQAYLRVFDGAFRHFTSDLIPRNFPSSFAKEHEDEMFISYTEFDSHMFFLLGSPVCELFRKECYTDENLLSYFKTLDRRLPDRGETPEGRSLLIRFLRNSSNRLYQVTPTSTRQSRRIEAYDWSILAPLVFPTVPDLSEWTLRTSELLRRLSTVRGLSPERLSRIVELRGTK